MRQPASSSNWRFVAGIAVLVLSCLLPFTAALLPLLGLPTPAAAAIGGLLVVGVPEGLVLVAIALLGRENFDRIIGSAKRFFFTTFFARPVSRPRYYVGLAICLLSIVPLYLVGYLPSWMPRDEGRVILLAGGDIAFVLSFFIMGGEFWGKFRSLFVWEGRT